MKNTKTLLAAALIAACAMSQPVLADVTESATLPALNTPALESTDLNFAFEQTSQPLQMANPTGMKQRAHVQPLAGPSVGGEACIRGASSAGVGPAECVRTHC